MVAGINYEVKCIDRNSMDAAKNHQDELQQNDAQQKRLFLWAVPRSISTAFFRAMMNRSKTHAILEPYSKPYYFGADAVSERYANQTSEGEPSTFADIKALCEQPYNGYDTVFIKDMAYYLANRMSNEDYLPRGYHHTFLLRNPNKSVYSLYKMSLNEKLTGWSHFDEAEAGFKELLQLYTLVTEKMGHSAIIIDADDLLQYPEPLLRAYCERVDIKFEASMLNWDDMPSKSDVFSAWAPWFEGVLTSKTFKPSPTRPVSPATTPQLPAHVRAAIDKCMPIYKKMHALRLTPNSLVVKPE